MSANRVKFVKLAEARTTRAIKQIQLIGNLSNRSNYSWNESDVKKIFSALESELRQSRKRFESFQVSKGVDFTLD